MKLRVFVIQPVDRETGRPADVVYTKLTRGAAQAVAKRHAPARITPSWADKNPDLDA